MSEKAAIKKRFPNLKGPTSFKVTSPMTLRYNCIAWAAGDETNWWWPIPGKYWPPNVARDVSLDAFVAAFQTLGYSVCEKAAHEPGVEKIVIYKDDKGAPTHASRQLTDGQWTSKLGQAWDISHKLPLGLEGTEYGSVAVFMERPIPQAAGAKVNAKA